MARGIISERIKKGRNTHEKTAQTNRNSRQEIMILPNTRAKTLTDCTLAAAERVMLNDKAIKLRVVLFFSLRFVHLSRMPVQLSGLGTGRLYANNGNNILSTRLFCWRYLGTNFFLFTLTRFNKYVSDVILCAVLWFIIIKLWVIALLPGSCYFLLFLSDLIKCFN